MANYYKEFIGLFELDFGQSLKQKEFSTVPFMEIALLQFIYSTVPLLMI